MGINWERKVFHLLFSLLLFFLLQTLSEKAFKFFLGVLLLGEILWEILRLKYPKKVPFSYLWEKLLKEREKKELSDAFFFLLGIFLSSFLITKHYLALTLLILGIADPLANIGGHLFLSKPLFREKTLSGSLTFFIASLLIAIFFFTTLDFRIINYILFLTLLELLSKRDNLWLPLGSALYLKIFLEKG